MSNFTLENQKKILKSWQYVKIVHAKDKKTKQFLENSTLINWTTGELKTITYNHEWHLKQSYLYNTFRIDYLNRIETEKGKIPVFVTITLPSKYHYSRIVGKNIIKNKNYDPLLTVEDGYNELNKIFRTLYKDFKVNRKYVSMKFIRVIEPHKSFVPHLHAVCYIEPYNVRAFLRHFGNVVKKYSLKQTKVKVLDSARYAVTYLLKYIKKTLEGDDVIRGWKIYHNIRRVLTMSNLNNGMTRDIFKQITRFVSFDKNDSRDYITQLLDKLAIDRTILNPDGTVKKYTEYVGSDVQYVVSIAYRINYNIDSSTYDYNIDDCIYKDDYCYKLDKLMIWNKSNRELVYNDMWFKFYKGDPSLIMRDIKDDCILEIEHNNIVEVVYLERRNDYVF